MIAISQSQLLATNTDLVIVHPPASVIVTVYSPATKLLTVLLVSPFDQANVNGAVAPDTVTAIAPSLPTQLSCVALKVTKMSCGPVILNGALAMHPCSLRCKMYCPIGNPFTGRPPTTLPVVTSITAN